MERRLEKRFLPLEDKCEDQTSVSYGRSQCRWEQEEERQGKHFCFQT
jgi:hypothetical protein